MHIHLQDWILQYGYAGVFFIIFMEMIGIPFPAETTLTLSGVEWMLGDFSFVPLFLTCVIANISGSSIAYLIGRYLGRPTILKFGRFVRLTEQKLDAAEKKFLQYRILIIIGCKFIAGIRILIPYMAGINRMSFAVFSFYNTIATILWVSTFLFVGHSLGLAWHRFHRELNRYFIPVGIALVLGAIIYYFWKAKKKRNQNQDTGSTKSE
ncbi:MAG TPA: DedA family protein [Bacillota bacterium]|nr:DedA family protein [Bacillota bacterium]